MKLTDIERMLVQSFQARDRDIYHLYIAPLQQEYQTALRLIEQRLGLESGAIGTTHDLNMQTWQVVAQNNEEATEE